MVGAAASFSEDGRHYIGAIQRTMTVVNTLAICSNEYVYNVLWTYTEQSLMVE